MKRPSRFARWQFRAAVFGLLPCVLGLGGLFAARWSDAVWMTDAGGFWPYTLALTSAAILLKLAWSPFEDTTSATCAWLTLLLTWFYPPMWVTAVEVPYAAAVVSRDGRAYLARDATHIPQNSIWLLTGSTGNRIVHNVIGKLRLSELEIQYSYTPSHIATRRDGDDLSSPLASAAGPILHAIATGPRTSRIALIEDRSVQTDVLAEICRTVVGKRVACPLKMTIAPSKESMEAGAVWSKQYGEAEAIEERHLPSLVLLLTQSDALLDSRDVVFRLILDLAKTSTTLAPLVQRSHRLDDPQFEELVRRILSFPRSGDTAAQLVLVSRLSEQQRQALRAKALDEATLSTLVDHAAALRFTDADVINLADRMRPGYVADPSVAVRALSAFGDRLPVQAQGDLVDGITNGGASHSLVAIQRLNYSPELRRKLMSKILADATPEDFSSARLSKEALQEALTPTEMRAIIEIAVKRAESSDKWLIFALGSLSIRELQPSERRSLVDGLLFKSPKDALEFVSKNRDYLEPAEVGMVTRDYARTVTREFCEHLSHRNNNRKTNYFSAAQLEIFRDCAQSKSR